MVDLERMQWVGIHLSDQEALELRITYSAHEGWLRWPQNENRLRLASILRYDGLARFLNGAGGVWQTDGYTTVIKRSCTRPPHRTTSFVAFPFQTAQ